MAEPEFDELEEDFAAPAEDQQLDEENRLKPEFVRSVRDALDQEDLGAVLPAGRRLDVFHRFELLAQPGQHPAGVPALKVLGYEVPARPPSRRKAGGPCGGVRRAFRRRSLLSHSPDGVHGL